MGVLLRATSTVGPATTFHGELIGTYSTGMKRRVDFSQAVAPQPAEIW
jgi:ABC-type multidrug transport system ATPase subunit